MRVLPCGHRYHLVCVDTWLELATFCPLCRKDFGTKEGEHSHGRVVDTL